MSMETAMKYKPYPAYKESGVEWLGEVPAHWEVKRVKHIADLQLSNVDKLSVEGQPHVQLCNYMDVYRNDKITSSISFMQATASLEQIRRLSLQKDDVLLTKDSETPDDIGIPAVVTEELDSVVCGYHLALLRPYKDLFDGCFLMRVIQSLEAV